MTDNSTKQPDKKPQAKVRRVSYETYAKIKAVGSGTLKDLHTRGAKYALHCRNNPKESPAMTFGQGAHAAVLEPQKYLTEFVIWSNGRRQGSKWETFCDQHRDKIILTADEAERVQSIARAVHAHPVAGPYVQAQGRTELTIEWTHPRTGYPCKVRIDKMLAKGKAMIEFKTARDISPRKFATACAQLGYDIQLAFYIDGMVAAGLGTHETPVKVIAVEPDPPHDVAVYDVPDDLLNNGRFKYEDAIDKLIECESSGIWPGIAETEELTLHLPAWAQVMEEITLTYEGEKLP